jgi:hypothetical protein
VSSRMRPLQSPPLPQSPAKPPPSHGHIKELVGLPDGHGTQGWRGGGASAVEGERRGGPNADATVRRNSKVPRCRRGRQRRAEEG